MIVLPIYLKWFPVSKSKVKNISLNLNWYRNAHYILNNNVKIAFKELIKDQLEWKKWDGEIIVTYHLYYSHMSDLDNWQSVVTKFFQDALKEYWCIEDDNMKFIVWNEYYVEWKDKDNPRFEVHIRKN